jgi:glycosyltransferase involved in cell wall biosynthesis
MPLPDGLVVFSDDWGRHPSSCQHLIRELLYRYRVQWFNTIGTRPPRLDLLTARRGLEKLRGWMGRDRGAIVDPDANPQVVDPMMWPTFGSALSRGLNRRLLKRAILDSVATPESTIGVTTLPIAADLVGRVPLARWVYYCVDDLAEWPGLDRDTLLAMERDLVERVDGIVAVSERLVERMADLGRESTLLTHGVDRWKWADPQVEVPAELEGLEEPWVVFWGVVDRRLATPWIESLATSLDQGTVLLVGPPNNPDPALEQIERVVQIGPMPFESLPAIAARAAALVMPYADMQATRAIQPLKLKEYLATGKPVIVSDLPACNDWRDACDVVGEAEVFSWTVLHRLEQGVSDEQKDARHRLAGEGWEKKAERFEQVLWGVGG